jgi:hypothetical protein
MATKAPKAITSPKAGTKPSEPLSLEAAAKKATQKSKLVKRKQQELKDGDSGLIYVPFYYADGRTTSVRVRSASVRQMLIPTPTDGDVVVHGNHVAGAQVGKATKPIRLSYGRKRIKRKVNGKEKNRLEQAWKELSVPQDANLIDIMHWVKQFKKKPGLLRYGKQVVVLSSAVARSGAGAVK